MVSIAGAVAGAAAASHSLWGYNRSNYFFDRKMRQEQEFKIMEYRNKQAALWRDDVRDLIGVTEKKMDSYLIVSTLQCGMCVGLFSEGRLEPGTPPWLLHFYMLTLGAAFLYLLMAVWLAMHASVVAQCSLVRLVTQLVRLPVPSWEELEEMRTYGQEYEELRMKHMLRVPFVGTALKRNTSSPLGVDGSSSPTASPPNEKAFAMGDVESPADPSPSHAAEDDDGCAGQGSSGGDPSDPWGLERHGSHIYELQQRPTATLRHVALVRRASSQYQCFEAFTRVAMTFGTNQLLFAIAYYCLGYVSVQDGAPVAAWTVVAIMVAVAVALIELDLSLTKWEHVKAQGLMITGPLAASAAVYLWSLHTRETDILVSALLPITYACHCLWLCWALKMCGVEMQGSGAVLPMKFRAVLYLDVFGWLTKRQPQDGSPTATKQPGVLQNPEATPRVDDSRARKVTCADTQLLTKDAVELLGLHEDEWQDSGKKPGRPEDPKAEAAIAGIGPSNATMVAHKEAFHPVSFFPEGHGAAGDERVAEGEQIVTGHDRLRPGRIPWRVFRGATWLLAALWAVGFLMSFGPVQQPTHPIVEGVEGDLAEELEGSHRGGKSKGRASGKKEHAAAHRHVMGTLGVDRADADHSRHLPALPEGELIDTTWPEHSGFMPRALSADPTGKQLVVADDFGAYAGMLWKADAPAAASSSLAGAPPGRLLAPVNRRVLTASFERVPPCNALEGQTLKDISVVCSEGVESACRLLVLHANGRNLSECPLTSRRLTSGEPDTAPGGPAPRALLVTRAGRATTTWTISGDWLHRKREHVESFAVDNQCLRVEAEEQQNTFMPDQVGCVVVGTTSGRIVQLRKHITNKKRLVPERAMRQRSSARAVGQGSIHAFPGGFVMVLRHGGHSVQALDSRQGHELGEWRLPLGVEWLTLSGGGDSIFMLGRRPRAKGADEGIVQLWRFPVPRELPLQRSEPPLLVAASGGSDAAAHGSVAAGDFNIQEI